jgi:cation-transporting ATPase 13A3/4/5
MLDYSYSLIFLDAFDIITIAVPAALPTTLQVGTSIALHRLRRNKIFCIAPQKVNIAGKVTVLCFDKTGTLTEDGLDLYGIRCVKQTNQRVEMSSLIVDCKEL